MKKLKTGIAALALCVFLGAYQPAMAQNDDRERTTVNTDMDDDADDTGKWGLAGLLGLLGLLGLRKRDNDARYTSTTTSPRRND